MSNRSTILDSFVTCLENITVANGFTNAIKLVERKSVFIDLVNDFPILMVLGGGEQFLEEMGMSDINTMRIRIRGYSKDENDPDGALCSLIADTIRCIESTTYNTNWEMTRFLEIITDEGELHLEGNGWGAFDLIIEVTYKFLRSVP